jgi:hypothetical protein
MSKEEKETPIDFADELLNIWASDFIESEKYRKWGMTYIDAMAQVYRWREGAKKNIETIKQFHNLLGLAIKYLEKK